MAEGRRSMHPIINFNFVHEGDRTEVRVGQNAETNINAANIEQLNLQHHEVDNEATEGMKEQDEIIHEVDALNLSSPETVKEVDNEATEGVEEQDEIIHKVDALNSSSPEPVQEKDPKRTAGNRGESHSIICGLLLDRATTLCRDSKYLEADSKLKKLVKIQGEEVGVYASLLIAEVSIKSGKQKKAKKTINDVVRLSMTSQSDVDDVIRHACDYLSDKSFVRAIVLLRISSEMYKINPSLSPDAIGGGILKCVTIMNDALPPMIESGDRSKTIALDFGLPYMLEMVDDMRALEACCPIGKAKGVALCGYWIGFIYQSTNEFKKGIESYNSGLDAMRHQFGQNALKYRICRTLLNNLGTAYATLGRYKIAEDYYLKAINAHNNVTDYRNDDEKRESIEGTQQNLKNVRNLMK